MGKSYFVDAEIHDFKKGEVTEKRLSASLSGRSGDFTFRALQEFQKEARRVFNAARKASETGAYVRLDVVVLEYAANDRDVVNSEAWQAEGHEELFYEEDDGKKAAYLEPNTRYTRETWGLILHADIVESLAEAGV